MDRTFLVRPDGAYSLDLQPAGITFFATRIRRTHGETIGELAVGILRENFPKAKHTNGILSRANHNFSSMQTRSTLSKVLAERSGVGSLDWHGFIDEFASKVLESERAGGPALVLADVANEPEQKDAWDVDTLPILSNLPMVFFGDGGSMKSYLAMYVAGVLANRGIPVLYADWEFSIRPHRERFGRLFQPMPRNVFYVRCEKPLKDEVERLGRIVAEHGIQYAICDSILFALDGKADEEQAGIYFRAVRQLGDIGSLHIAHTAKHEGETDKSIYGSVFFTNGARATWMVCKAIEHPPGEEYIGAFHRKANTESLLKPRGFKFTFARDRVSVESLNVETVDELAARLPILDRMKKLLSKGAMLPKDIGAQLGVGVPYVQAVAARHQSQFIRMGPRIGVREIDLEF